MARSKTSDEQAEAMCLRTGRAVVSVSISIPPKNWKKRKTANGVSTIRYADEVEEGLIERLVEEYVKEKMCQCHRIQANDPSRHFRGCPKRMEKTPAEIEESVCRASPWFHGDKKKRKKT